MELTTVRRLADLNRRFYARHAEAFANSRPRLPPGVERVLPLIPPEARVLEIGCGDGKVARALGAQGGARAYLGLDLSPAMLERARRYTAADARLTPAARARLSFALADLTDPDWTRALPPAEAPGVEPLFDWILAFAVFHHLPGYGLRARVLRTLARHLAPGGAVAMSNWQLTRSERLRGRIVPWEELGLTQSDVEPDDYLLTWERRGQKGLRYVHVLAEAEVSRLAEAAGLDIAETFAADGATGDLADYAVMRRPDEHATMR